LVQSANIDDIVDIEGTLPLFIGDLYSDSQLYLKAVKVFLYATAWSMLRRRHCRLPRSGIVEAMILNFVDICDAWRGHKTKPKRLTER